MNTLKSRGVSPDGFYIEVRSAYHNNEVIFNRVTVLCNILLFAGRKKICYNKNKYDQWYETIDPIRQGIGFLRCVENDIDKILTE